MTKKLVLERLQATIDNLRSLPNSKFSYEVFVDQYDSKKECGTVCCVAGWYPKWFPKSGLIWEDDTLSVKSRDKEIDTVLKKHHGLSKELISILFYGQERTINYRFKLPKAKKNIMVDNSASFSLGLENRDYSSKTEVLEMFKYVYELIDKDLIEYN